MRRVPLIVRMDEVKALADEVRILILDLLSKKPMSVQEIADELRKRGIYRNVNTVRYHLQALKEAGLIELVATKEVKGGVLKYYAARRKVYPYEVPEDIEKALKPVVKEVYPKLKKLVLEVMEENAELIRDTAKKLKPCPYCVTRHFAEYVILEAVRHALGQVMADKDVARKLSELE